MKIINKNWGLLVVLLFPLLVFASETEGDTIDYTMCVAVYDYNCYTTNKEGKAKIISCGLAVQIGKNITCSMGLAFHDGIKGMEGLKESKQFIPMCYLNYPKNQITALETMPYNKFKTKETMGEINWKLFTEKDSIGGYVCQKATCTYYGRKWTVWFTKDIPCQAGPWRLHGLPGLIMKAEADSTHTFIFHELRRVKEPIIFQVGSEFIKSTHKKFVKYRNSKLLNEELLNDPNYLAKTINTANIDNMTIIKGTVIINGIPSMDTDTKYQPLELQ